MSIATKQATGTIMKVQTVAEAIEIMNGVAALAEAKVLQPYDAQRILVAYGVLDLELPLSRADTARGHL